MDSPEFLPLLLRVKDNHEKPIILIIEDGDACLAPRKSDNISAITSLLNLSDGILGSIIDIKMIITPRIEEGKNINRVTFKLKDPPKTISEEEFFNFGVTAGKQDDTKNILDLYTSGKISKSEAAFQIQNIIPEIKNSKSLMYGSEKNPRQHWPILKPKSRFDKLYEGYISTLDDSDIMKSFPKFLKKETGQTQIQYDKIRQVKEVMNRLNDDDFLNIELNKIF